MCSYYSFHTNVKENQILSFLLQELPGNIEAFYSGLINARASGYVKEWYQDIGARVKQGQVLAIIDTPDLDQQLAQARADLQTAQANEKLSTVTADRWQTLATRNIVSQQAKDEKVGDLQAKTATTQAAQANVARLESLQALQQAALEDRAGERWLEQQELLDAPRLAQVVQVEAGWEPAVEAVLERWLQSLVVGDTDRIGAALDTLEQASLDFIEQGGSVKPVAGSLAERVQSAPAAVIEWLNGVGTAGSLQQAWELRGSLGAMDSVITADGEWIGRNWLRIARGQSGQDSMLAREKMIGQLQEEIRQLTAEADSLTAEIERAASAVEASESQLQELQGEYNQVHRRRSEVDGRLESRGSSIRLLTERQDAVNEEGRQLREQIGLDEKKVSAARG